ncbi:MAG: glycoside hydrolase family 9 protein, partial [Bacteroidota bacterium]|nr:glycoside hydrolase family 9 protein [Bacteroidota bacterium]
EDNPVTTDIVIDILDVDYPKPFNAELIDCLTGKVQKIDFQVDDYKVIFKNITVTKYPKIIRFNALMTRGYLKGEEPKTEEEKIETARTIRRIKQQTDSWSPLAENQIIAQPTTIRPIVAHGGYHQLGNKRAVIWTNNKKLSGYFEIINLNNNKQHPATQPVVYRGKLEDAGFHIWGGNNLIADFSDFNELGFYKIRLVFEQDEREIADSYGFSIKPSLYVDFAQKASVFLYYQRCGMEIPGWHKACHTDDAVIMPDGKRIDASGGWHSAGDLNKWIGPAHFAMRGLITLYETFPEKFAADKRNGIPKLIDEAWWEVMFYNKVYYQGSFLSIITPGANPWVWLGPPENAPQRILTLEHIEKIHQRSNSVTTLFTAASMAGAAHLMAPYKNDDYEKTVKIAEECYEINRKTDPNKVTSRGTFGVGLGDNFLMFQAGLLQLDMELYRITQDNKYKIDAKERVEKILSLNNSDGTFFTDEAKTNKQSHIDIHYLALYEYLITNPETPFKGDIKKVFINYLNYMKPLLNLSPFGQVGRYTKDGEISNIPG